MLPLLLLTACRETTRPVPLEAVPVPGVLPYVRAWSGARELRMGADSGSELPAVLFPEAADALGAPPQTDAAVQPCTVPIRVGPQAPVAPCYVALAAHAPMDGLLGWPVLGRRPWHLDWAHGRHEFSDAVPREVQQHWASLPLAPRAHAAPMIPGVGACMLDTGAPHDIYLPAELWKRVAASLPPQTIRCYYGESPAAGGAFVAECARVRSFRLGCFRWRNVLVCESFCPDYPDIILGCGFLRRWELWLDGRQRRLYYRPYAGASGGSVLSGG